MRHDRGTGFKDSLFHPGLIEGIGSNIGELILGLYFSTPPTSTREAMILGALATGEGFNFDTGMQVTQDQSGDSARMRATVSFSRLKD